MAKRVSLNQRRSKKDDKGVDALIQSTTPEKTIESSQPEKKATARMTIHVRPEQVIDLETIQLEERKRTGKKPKKSELMQEALDLLIEKYRKT